MMSQHVVAVVNDNILPIAIRSLETREDMMSLFIIEVVNNKILLVAIKNSER